MIPAEGTCARSDALTKKNPVAEATGLNLRFDQQR
jgi:hypothetical protein